MSHNLLGKIASEHIRELQKMAAPGKAPVPAKPAPAKPAPRHTQPYDAMGMPPQKNPKKPQVFQESWVPHWPKGKDIMTGP